MFFSNCVLDIYTPEAFPTSIRTFAFGITNTGATIAGIITAPVGGYLFDSGAPMWSIVGLYSIVFLIGCIVSLFMEVETLDQVMVHFV